MTKLRLYREKMDGYRRFRDALNAIQMIGASELRALRSTLEARFGSLLNVALLHRCILNDARKNERVKHIKEQIHLLTFSMDQTGCGVHNQGAFDASVSVQESFVFEEGYDPSAVKPFCVGFRGRSFFVNKFKKTRVTYFLKLRKDRKGFLISYSIDRVFYNSSVEKHIFVFNRFETAFKSTPTFYELVNFFTFIDFMSYGVAKKQSPKLGNITEFCQTISSFGNVFSWYRYQYLAIISDCSDDNEYSSIGSRIVSLMSAVKNTETILEGMMLVYNKLRQEVITTELLEFGLHVMLHEAKKRVSKSLLASYRTFRAVVSEVKSAFFKMLL